jgi:hypothetical protein
MSRAESTEERERIAERNARIDTLTALAEQASQYMADCPWKSSESLLLVKATKPDGRRVESALRLHTTFLGIGIEATPVSPARGEPVGETVSFRLLQRFAGQREPGIPHPHHQIPLQVIEDVVFLTSDLGTPRPRVETPERREVSKISRDRYQQLSGQRLS